MKDDHCWHDGDHGTTLGNGRSGQWSIQCCHCGLTGHRTWKLERKESKGHGPYYFAEKQVNTYPEGPCPVRSA